MHLCIQHVDVRWRTETAIDCNYMQLPTARLRDVVSDRAAYDIESILTIAETVMPNSTEPEGRELATAILQCKTDEHQV